MRIVLIGLSGTGKTNTGAELARRLGWSFVDTDTDIVARAGKPIHRIFSEDGEPVFRRLEAEAVRLALAGERCVVSMGGGAVMDPASRDLLRGCLVVLLEAGMDEMVRRLTADADREPRPMLGGGDQGRKGRTARNGRKGDGPHPNPLPGGEGVSHDPTQHSAPSTQDSAQSSILSPQHSEVRARLERLKMLRDPIYRELSAAVVSTDDVDVPGAAARVEAIARGNAGLSLPLHDDASDPLTIPIRSAAGTYQVVLGAGILDRAGDLFRGAGLPGRVRIIADASVHQLHGQRLERALQSSGYQVTSFGLPPGEATKSLESASRLYDWLIEVGTERRDLIIAFGGGVAGDLAGFVAATFLRGLRLVQVPTSLLAQVDSSVGGKVAVNHPQGKNLIGAFYPPALVLADVGVLATLPRRELSAALAEIVKHGVILDEGYVRRLEDDAERMLRLDTDALGPVVARSIELKAGVVEQDEREAGMRAILNYGHTIGHAVESVTGFEQYRHGEAVAIGMVGAADLSVRLGMLDPADAERQNALLERFGLPTRIPGLRVDELMAAMGHDKKSSEGKLTWVLPEAIGRVSLRRDVPSDLVRQVLATLGARSE